MTNNDTNRLWLSPTAPTNECWYDNCRQPSVAIPLFGGFYSICPAHKAEFGFLTQDEIDLLEATNKKQD